MAKPDRKIADVDKQIDEVAEFAMAGKRAQAEKLGGSVLSIVDDEISALKVKITELEQRRREVRRFVPSGQLPMEGMDAPDQPAPLSKSEKRKRREEILRVARKVGDELEVFSSEDVTRVLIEEGVEMGVPRRRANTAVGAFLRSSQAQREFEKDPDEAGLYRKISRGDDKNSGESSLLNNGGPE